MRPPLKAVRDALTGFVPPRLYWELRAAWRPMRAIIGRDDARLHLASGEECVTLMDRLGLLAGCRTTLGIGVGGGRVEHWLAPRVGRCCGVDISLGMARLAVKNVGAKNALVVVGSGGDLACFRERAFDLVYSFIVFQHVGDGKVRGYFRETARVLQPGGAFLFQIAVEPGRRRRFVPFRERHPYAIRWRTVEDVWRWLAESGLTPERLVGPRGEPLAREEVAAAGDQSIMVVARKPGSGRS